MRRPPSVSVLARAAAAIRDGWWYKCGETAARFLNLSLLDWKVLPAAATPGWIYNFATPATTVVDGLVLDSGRIDSKANLSGILDL